MKANEKQSRPLFRFNLLKNRNWFAIRIVIATILLFASGMKAYQLATTPSLGEGLLHARWFNILVVEFELFFGIWLFFGMLPRLTWLASIGCFSVFASVSFYKAISGEASCGCFGTALINPWITMVLNLVVIGLLLHFRPKNDLSGLSYLFENPLRRELTLFLGISIIIGGAVYGWIAQMTFERLNVIGQVLEGNVVKLEPVAWIGKEFPLRDYVNEGPDLMVGKWTVLLSRPGCADCEGVRNELYNQMDREETSVVLLNVVSSGKGTGSNFRSLASEINWIVETPLVLELQDGIVYRVRDRSTLLSEKMKLSCCPLSELFEKIFRIDGRCGGFSWV